METKKTAVSKTSIEPELGPLSAAERKAIMLMRSLEPYQKIEIKLVDNKQGKVSVTLNATVREDFPTDMT